MKIVYECAKPDCSAHVQHGKLYCPDHLRLRENIIHGLRNQDWSRIEAENEADRRLLLAKVS